MAKSCVFTGKKAVNGNRKKYRGKAKYLGGVGKKILGTSKRKFKPNLPKGRCVVDGGVESGGGGGGGPPPPSAAVWWSSPSRYSRSRRSMCKSVSRKS